jgi:uncharacterized repeat protein (TIGR01451 family)
MRNYGPDPATGIVITGLLPDSVTPLWAKPAQPVCERLGRYVGCNVGDLQGGDTATVVLDLSIGGTETIITGTQLAGVSVDRSVPLCAIGRDAARPQITCHLNRLQSGAEAQVQIGVNADMLLVGALDHTATIQADQADPNPSNNSATFTMMVGPATMDETSEPEGLLAATSVPTTTDLILQANGPSDIIAGQPFTYTYTITNQGGLVANDVRFEDALPADLTLISHAPGLPLCQQEGQAFTCSLPDVDSGETVTFTLVITGHAGQPIGMELDPLLPGWPICYVVKERTWLHIVHCELGSLQPDQATHVQLVLSAIGVQERTTTNTASVSADEADPNPANNTITTTMTVQAPVEP